jgi:glycosyltransferase involved in cell wall biosynthesis
MNNIKNNNVESTIAITTKNRKDYLRRAVESALSQVGNIEVMVIDDGSSDGTTSMIRNEFPAVNLVRKERSAGYIIRRNESIARAKGTFVFTIDDDAEFSTPKVVQQTLTHFSRPCVGAVAIPYVDVKHSPTVKQKAPDDQQIHCTFAYRGTAHALRKDLFLDLGGYRECLVHQGEEMDYCVRMMDRGAVVVLGTSDVIYHYESPRRSFGRMDYYGRRNDVLFGWHNVPGSILPSYLLIVIINTLRVAWANGRVRKFVEGTAAGLTDIWKYYDQRDPVAMSTYWLFRKLRKEGPLPLPQVEDILVRTSMSSADKK